MMRGPISKFLKPMSSVMSELEQSEQRRRGLTSDFDITDVVGFKNLKMGYHRQHITELIISSEVSFKKLFEVLKVFEGYFC